MKINWKWPATPENGLVPWYLIAYRVIFMPMIYAGIALAWLGIVLANGPYTARQWLKRAT